MIQDEIYKKKYSNSFWDLIRIKKSVLGLSLKTPFVNLRPERAGLRRKAAGRRKQVSVDAFDEAVEKRLERRHNQDYTVVQDGRTLQDSDWHKFTLGLSSVTVPELTTDVVLSNTELYAQPRASVSEPRDADGGVTEAEMKIDDDDDELQDVVQDQQNMCESNVSKPQPDPSEHPEPDSQSQEEVEMMPPSHEDVSLSPEEIPFAPTQAMVDRVSQPREQEEEEEEEEHESAIQEAQVEEMDQRESASLREEEPSHPPQRITRRAYHSEGGAFRNGVMARGRGTKSLGMGQDPTEKLEESSEELQGFAGGTELEELVTVEEEPHRSLASSSAFHATKPSPSLTYRDVLVQNADEGDVIRDLDQSESEEVVASGHVSPTVDFPAAEEEEEVEEEQEEEEEEAEDAQSEELSMQTPGFIRQRKQVSTPGALATPTVLKALNAGPAPKVVKPRPKRKPQRVSAGVLPKSYVMTMFKHFAKTKVAGDVYPIISDILQRYFDRLADDLEVYSAHAKRKTIEVEDVELLMRRLQRYFDRLADDLEVYSAHAKRKTIEVEDVELLMRRQGFVTDSTPVNVLIEKFLPLEYRKLLIPVATSGNKVVPDQRR
ncbi:hypothetical protein PDJAM_G00022330 [Pangasius djambal]|uniref:Uncharacterized protein n=1 Tax=Pangasius djambal TaxID=1691987 RepID=A0ACC5YNI3_9TELE|nr:hypothetical protein [Pangasius djambal]